MRRSSRTRAWGWRLHVLGCGAAAIVGCGPSATPADAPMFDVAAEDDVGADASALDVAAENDARTDPSMLDAAADNDGGADAITLDVSADAPADGASLIVVPTSLEFGTLSLGSSSGPQTVRATNAGRSPLGPLSMAVTGMHAGSFALTRDSCSGATLAPGLSCELEVVMSGAPPGDLVASLDLMTTAGAIGSVALAGRVIIGPDYYVDTATHDFGSWASGERSAPRTFVLRNPGTVPTGVVTVTLTGANPADFVIDSAMSTCDGVPLSGGASCSVLVSFAPTASGARSGVLRFTAAPGGTTSAALAGTGL